MSRLKVAFKFVFVVALTALLAWVGLASGRGAGHVPAIWWANAALASVILLDDRRRSWLPLFAAGYIGNVLGHLYFGDPIWETFCLSACDVGEAAIAVLGVSYAVGRRVDLTQQRQLLRFVAFAVLLGPAVASVAASLLLHWVTGSALMVTFVWFPASALGMSVVIPLVLGLARRETRELFLPNRLANTLLYLFMIAVATTAIFSRADFPWLFLIFPPLLFLVVRLGLSGGVLGCCVVAAIGMYFFFARLGLIGSFGIGALADAIVYYERALGERNEADTSAAALHHKVGLALGSLGRLKSGIGRPQLPSSITAAVAV